MVFWVDLGLRQTTTTTTTTTNRPQSRKSKRLKSTTHIVSCSDASETHTTQRKKGLPTRTLLITRLSAFSLNEELELDVCVDKILKQRISCVVHVG
jgi:hypothetical protein